MKMRDIENGDKVVLITVRLNEAGVLAPDQTMSKYRKHRICLEHATRFSVIIVGEKEWYKKWSDSLTLKEGQVLAFHVKDAEEYFPFPLTPNETKRATVD